jgi:hypothetical protein
VDEALLGAQAGGQFLRPPEESRFTLKTCFQNIKLGTSQSLENIFRSINAFKDAICTF